MNKFFLWMLLAILSVGCSTSDNAKDKVADKPSDDEMLESVAMNNSSSARPKAASLDEEEDADSDDEEDEDEDADENDRKEPKSLTLAAATAKPVAEDNDEDNDEDDEDGDEEDDDEDKPKITKSILPILPSSTTPSTSLASVSNPIMAGKPTPIVPLPIIPKTPDGSTKAKVEGPKGAYTVMSHDTLMFIAFKIYGDYSRWKELAHANPNAFVGKSYQLKAGSVIKYQPPITTFEWDQRGMPYLIVRGDTLGRVSNKVYKTPKYWRQIWENNKPMIKNPNLIFAGFTIYYKPQNTLLSMY